MTRPFIEVPRLQALHMRDSRDERIRKVIAINKVFERLQRAKNVSDRRLEEDLTKELRDVGVSWDFDEHNRPLWKASIVEDPQ